VLSGGEMNAIGRSAARRTCRSWHQVICGVRAISHYGHSLARNDFQSSCRASYYRLRRGFRAASYHLRLPVEKVMAASAQRNFPASSLAAMTAVKLNPANSGDVQISD